MTKKIISFTLLAIATFFIVYIGIIYLLEFIVGTIFRPVCSNKMLETVTSPNEKYKIITYRVNCGATVDYSVIGKLCIIDKACIEIYDCYNEKDSYVYWIDNEMVFINNKVLNINNDRYDWREDDDYYSKRYKKESLTTFDK